METFGGKDAVVVGAGRSGFVSALLLVREGARVTLFDERPKEAVEKTLGQAIPPRLAFVRGMPGEKAASGVDLVVLSPGVPAEKLPREALRRAGAPVWGELELGYRRFRGQVAAVGGTNGKSTVTTLLGEMASRAFGRVFVGGNLGTPLAAAAGEPYDWGVIEVSSFQLEAIETFRPRVAVLLNITEDHRNRYRDFAAYAEAKMAVFRNQGPNDAAVVNADDPEVGARAGAIPSGRIPFSITRTLDQGIFLAGG